LIVLLHMYPRRVPNEVDGLELVGRERCHLATTTGP